MHKPTALVVDDEPAIRELIELTLTRMDVACVLAADLKEAHALLQTQAVDLCLTDMKLPDGNGLELVSHIQAHAPQVPVAVITAHGNVESAVQALKNGAFDFVSKPVDLTALRNLVSTALKLRDQKHIGDRGSTQLLGRSPAIEQVRVMVSKVARSQAPVHISGESGTGKELVARLIHENGARAENAFVAVNCGAIPGELMESEFFGHRKGSFTGAVADKDGLFQAAQGGTLFLDEVAELPLHMQVKLLRVIQEKAIRAVGAQREIPVDVRILSATHRNLAEMVRAGRFREDLYYRINVIELRVPALRDRPEDMTLLAEHILARLAQSREPARLTPDATALLQTYGFPGNVRELENILERATTLAEGELIHADDIHLQSAAETDEVEPVTGPGAQPLGKQLGEVEKEAIKKALEQARYNKTAAAKLLGMSFRQLRYRIKKLGLE
ncbi:MAG TPA: sigma-54 dependent transcriptional regulator [Gammaproteobacteria bacterium]|jgi:two-component system response regulator PilR (NtrC family)|nr:sigma-54 dependent transcriptional regulator [Gammaproteobacteria bacterium]